MLLSVIACVLLFAGTNCMASGVLNKKHSSTNNFPPNKYELNEVEIKFTRHAGMIKGATRKQITVAGNGSSTIELNGKEHSLNYSSTELVTLINSLYKIRFFDLPTRYNLNYTVSLNDDGSLTTNALNMLDSTNTTACFSLSNFEKCVTYSNDKPYELENIIQSIFETTND